MKRKWVTGRRISFQLVRSHLPLTRSEDPDYVRQLRRSTLEGHLPRARSLTCRAILMRSRNPYLGSPLEGRARASKSSLWATAPQALPSDCSANETLCHAMLLPCEVFGGRTCSSLTRRSRFHLQLKSSLTVIWAQSIAHSQSRDVSPS